MIYLAHHGIKGQKWGVRRYQNYDGSLTDAGKKRYNKNNASDSGRGYISSLANMSCNKIQHGTIDLDKYDKTCKVLTKIFGEYGTESIIASYHKSIIKKLHKERDIKTLAEAPRLSKSMSAYDSTKIVNRNYPKVDAEHDTVNNCTYCTLAMIMREKGYDVKAIEQTNVLDDFTLMKHSFKNVKRGTEYYSDSKGLGILRQCFSHGGGAYGDLSLYWKKSSGGHSLFWKVSDDGTELAIYDSQRGFKITPTSTDWEMFVNNTESFSVTNYQYGEPKEGVLDFVQSNAK